MQMAEKLTETNTDVPSRASYLRLKSNEVEESPKVETIQEEVEEPTEEVVEHTGKVEVQAIGEVEPTGEEKEPTEELEGPTGEVEEPRNEINSETKTTEAETTGDTGIAQCIVLQTSKTSKTAGDHQCTIKISQHRPRNILNRQTSCVKRSCSIVLLTMFVILYAIGGGFLFSHLERNREISFSARVEKWKNDTAILLATELRQVSPYEEVWARKVFHYLDVFEKDLLRAAHMGYRRSDDSLRGQVWTFRSALFFSVSLMTTTGYGTTIPHSEWSRTVLLGYSAIGIPLTLTWLITTGCALARVWSWMFDRLCCRACHKNFSRVYPQQGRSSSAMSRVNDDHHLFKEQVSREAKLGVHHDILNSAASVRNSAHCDSLKETPIPEVQVKDSSWSTSNDHFALRPSSRTLSQVDQMVAILFAGVLFVLYFVFGSAAIAISEGWTLPDSVYFNFVMFSTIGLGCNELEAGISTQKWQAVQIRQNTGYLVFLMFGFCIMFMFIMLVYSFCRSGKTKHRIKKRNWYKTDLNNLTCFSAEMKPNG